MQFEETTKLPQKGCSHTYVHADIHSQQYVRAQNGVRDDVLEGELP